MPSRSRFSLTEIDVRVGHIYPLTRNFLDTTFVGLNFGETDEARVQVTKVERMQRDRPAA